MIHKSSILWFRNDLRLHDHAALNEALRKSSCVYPVYCFDLRHFYNTELGLPKTGTHRAQFLLESLHDLRSNLRAIGSDLIIRQGPPERVIPQLASEIQATYVVASKEVTHEEVLVEDKRGTASLIPKGIELDLLWQSTLLHVDDIPWPINNVPDIFLNSGREAKKLRTSGHLYRSYFR